MDNKSIYGVLSRVQAEINVPKGNYNSYGGYKYRSLEDINAAAKPVCEKYGAGYAFTDEIVPIVAGSDVRWYLKATITFWCDTGETLEVSGWAREPLDKKGMDQAQVTGLASSYARKYAACAMFAIDSGEEIDAMDNRTPNKGHNRSRGTESACERENPAKSTPRHATADQLNQLTELVDRFAGLTGKTRAEVCEALESSRTMNGANLADLSAEEADIAIGLMNNWCKKKEDAIA